MSVKRVQDLPTKLLDFILISSINSLLNFKQEPDDSFNAELEEEKMLVVPDIQIKKEQVPEECNDEDFTLPDNFLYNAWIKPENFDLDSTQFDNLPQEYENVS